MWTFKETAQIGQNFGQWYALVTLEKDGVPESFFINFNEQEPTPGQAEAAGTQLALQKSLSDAPSALGNSIPTKDFIARFTKSEFVRIFRVAEVNDDVFFYVKTLDFEPTVNRADPRVVAGLQALEDNNLLDYVGRASEILGW